MCILIFDNRKQNPTLKLLFAIDNINSIITAASDTGVLIITCHSKSCFILLNNWEDSFYFPTTFLTLFLFRNGGYLRNRQQLVSILA